MILRKKLSPASGAACVVSCVILMCGCPAQDKRHQVAGPTFDVTSMLGLSPRELDELMAARGATLLAAAPMGCARVDRYYEMDSLILMISLGRPRFVLGTDDVPEPCVGTVKLLSREEWEKDRELLEHPPMNINLDDYAIDLSEFDKDIEKLEGKP